MRTKPRDWVSIIAMPLVLGTAGPAISQQQAMTEIRLAALAADEVAGRIGTKEPTKVESRIARWMHTPRDGFHGPFPNPVMSQIRKAFNAETARREDVLVCRREDPSTCTLVGTSRFIMISEPRIEGDTARVNVFVLFATLHPQNPVAETIWQVEFRRTRTDWTAVAARVITES